MVMIISILPTLCSKTINYNRINSASYEYTSHSYLINTDWGEKSPYYEKCPMNNQPGRPSYRNRLGCWSVAIGTIINYHQLQSQGSVDYTCTHWYIDPQHIQNNLDEHVYDW